jgi:DNA-binding transcriptional LysR family regulator
MIDTICQVSGFELQPLIETTTIESLFSLVHSGAGATILSKTLLEMYNEDGKLIAIPVENPSLCREVGIIYHRDKYIGKAAHGFIELIRAYVKKLKAEEEQTLCES